MTITSSTHMIHPTIDSCTIVCKVEGVALMVYSKHVAN